MCCDLIVRCRVSLITLTKNEQLTEFTRYSRFIRYIKIFFFYCNLRKRYWVIKTPARNTSVLNNLSKIPAFCRYKKEKQLKHRFLISLKSGLILDCLHLCSISYLFRYNVTYALTKKHIINISNHIFFGISIYQYEYCIVNWSCLSVETK